MSYNFFCPNCLSYLGKGVERDFYCEKCHVQLDVNTLSKELSYFLTFDIGGQAEEKISLPDLNFHLTPRTLAYDVGEITTSQGYHQLPMLKDDVSVTWNTDGVPLYESSGNSIWPLLLQIYELPQAVRSKNVLPAGLWYGEKKPDMNTFLKPFVEELNVLSSTGIQWADPQGNVHTSRIFPGPCSVDSSQSHGDEHKPVQRFLWLWLVSPRGQSSPERKQSCTYISHDVSGASSSRT